MLRPLITPNNTIAAFPGSNALIITDYAENLRRIDRIIASLDQPPGGEPMLVPLRYASALDLVPLLNRLLGRYRAGGAGAPRDAQQRVTLVADPRSNSVLMRADNPARAARVRQLIEQLDTPGRPGGNMFIVYLKNAEAARVAQTLRALMSGGGDAAPLDAAAVVAVAATGCTTGGSGTHRARRPRRRRRRRHRFTGSRTAAGDDASSAGGATIQADIANNALIIMAPEPLYNNLRADHRASSMCAARRCSSRR